MNQARLPLRSIFAVVRPWCSCAGLSAAASMRFIRLEQVIVTQFGKPVGRPDHRAGLHFKLPFIQDSEPHR